MPLGYHRFTLEVGGKTATSHLLSAPLRAYEPGGRSRGCDWGVFLPLYALHSERSWGAGDFSNLEALTEWVTKLGGGMVATLPLLAAFLDEPFEPGPYSPASRLFWNEFYLDVFRIPELRHCPRAQALLQTPEFSKEVGELQAAPLVDYRRQMALKRRVGDEGEVVGSDFSERMLELARAKAHDVEFEQGNALDLPYEDASFDAATVGFGARNFSDLARGLAEITRVVRPGGRVVVLEMTTPERPPLSWFFRLWFDGLVPLMGRIAGDPDAYSYLPSSVRRFPGARGLAAAMAAVGLVRVRWVITAGGIIAIHSGQVEEAPRS